MGKKFQCKDVGIQGCTWEAKANTEEEIMEMVQAHAPVHDIKEVTPELVAKIKAAIKDD